MAAEARAEASRLYADIQKLIVKSQSLRAAPTPDQRAWLDLKAAAISGTELCLCLCRGCIRRTCCDIGLGPDRPTNSYSHLDWQTKRNIRIHWENAATTGTRAEQAVAASIQQQPDPHHRYLSRVAYLNVLDALLQTGWVPADQPQLRRTEHTPRNESPQPSPGSRHGPQSQEGLQHPQPHSPSADRVDGSPILSLSTLCLAFFVCDSHSGEFEAAPVTTIN